MIFILIVAMLTGIIGFGFFTISLLNLPYSIDSLILSTGVMINAIMWMIVSEEVTELKRREKNE
jgi:drug/metabolite transporter (DMT)-like permease